MHEDHWKRVRASHHDRDDERRTVTVHTDHGPFTFDFAQSIYGNDVDARNAAMDPAGSRLLIRGDRIIGVGLARPRIHPVTRLLMEAFRVDIDAGMAWVRSAHVWRAEDCVEVPRVEGVAIRTDGEMVFEEAVPGMVFVENAVCFPKRTIPEIAIGQCKGRLLREVVSIPELDAHDIPILRAVNLKDDFGLSLTIVPNQGHDAIPDPEEASDVP